MSSFRSQFDSDKIKKYAFPLCLLCSTIIYELLFIQCLDLSSSIDFLFEDAPLYDPLLDDNLIFHHTRSLLDDDNDGKDPSKKQKDRSKSSNKEHFQSDESPKDSSPKNKRHPSRHRADKSSDPQLKSEGKSQIDPRSNLEDHHSQHVINDAVNPDDLHHSESDGAQSVVEIDKNTASKSIEVAEDPNYIKTHDQHHGLSHDQSHDHHRHRANFIRSRSHTDEHVHVQNGSVFLVFMTVVVCQSLIWWWKKRYHRSFFLFTLGGLWLFPILWSIYLLYWRMIVIWALFSLCFAVLLKMSRRKPMNRKTPRFLYSWFFMLYKVTNGLAVLGYCLFLADFFGFGYLVFGPHPKEEREYRSKLMHHQHEAHIHAMKGIGKYSEIEAIDEMNHWNEP